MIARRLTIAVVLALLSEPVWSQPTPTAPARGGYGTGIQVTTTPASRVTTPASKPVAPTPQMSAWMAAAQKRFAAELDDAQHRALAMRKECATINDRIDARVTQRMQAAGFTPGEMASCYTRRDLDNPSGIFTPLYNHVVDFLGRINLPQAANPVALSIDPVLTFSDGNHRVIEAALPVLDDTMAAFRFFDGVLQRRLLDFIDDQAEWRFVNADERRLVQQIQTLDSKLDYSLPHMAPSNVDLRAKLRPLESKDRRLLDREDIYNDVSLSSAEISIIGKLPLLSALSRVLDQKESVLVLRTDSPEPLEYVAKRVEPFFAGVATQSKDIYSYPAFDKARIDPRAFIRFYVRQMDGLAEVTKRYFERGGATREEIEEMRASYNAMSGVQKDMQTKLDQIASYWMQGDVLAFRASEIGQQMVDMQHQANRLRQAGNSDAAAEIEAEEKPLQNHAFALNTTTNQLNGQEGSSEKQENETIDSETFFKAPKRGRVIAVRFVFSVEQEPAKQYLPWNSLKGAPVSLSVTRRFADLPFGVPLHVELDWQRGTDPAPPQQTLTLAMNGKTVPVTLYANEINGGYHSANLIFSPPGTVAKP